MKLLIKSATILAPNTVYHQQVHDILIENGRIQAIESSIKGDTNTEMLDAKGAYVSAGWVDLGAQICDPGFEHREDMTTALAAAAAGGFTALASFPNTNPTIQSKSEVRYLKQQSAGNIVDLLPIGAISRNCIGEEIAELYDMHTAGAVAFSDGNVSIQHAGMLLRALDYTKAFDGLVMHYPYDTSLVSGGQLHEGAVSTQLGMRGIPSIAEELMLQRDIDLLSYTNSRLHVLHVSTAHSVELIRQAKAKGLRITASTPAINLACTHEAVQDFDTNCKVLPPLRTAEDQAALYKGLQDGTIDGITSNHVPLEEEAKKLEFPYADFGVIGLETAFALSYTQLKSVLSVEALVEKLAYFPRKLLKLDVPTIAVQAVANLTVFDTESWTFTEKDIHSKSKNTPFIGQQLEGRVRAVVNNERWFIR